MEIIQYLDAVKQMDVIRVGGKGANLGALQQAGFSVPSGFVLLTSAYQQFVQENGLQETIEQLATSVTLDDVHSLQNASFSIRALFETGQMSDAIMSAVKVAYAHLGDSPVAVRSSATAEDLPEASFAGQQETYLNVQSEEDVLTAIRQCWSSLWTTRALAYRLRRGIGSHTVRLAIVVQQMVHADSAGVLFTINPITGHADEMVINATWGLGEALVEGHVTPDMVIVDRATGAVKKLEVGRKEVTIAAAERGIKEYVTDAVQRQKTVLTNKQITDLTQLGDQIETLFGTPQDIEWAIADEHIFILQARPITTRITEIQKVPPGDDTWDRESDVPAQPFDIWTRTNVGENLPFPVTPLTSTNFGRIFGLDAQSQQQTTQSVKRLYGRIYINEGAIIHDLTEKYGLPAALIDKMWGSRPRGTQQARPGFRPLRLLRSLPSLIRQSMSTPKKQKQPKHTPQQFFAQIDSWVTTFMSQDLSLLTDQELWASGLPLWRERGAYVFNTNIRISIPSALFYAVLERLTKWWTQYHTAQDAVTGLPGMYSAEVGPMLWRMAQTLREYQLSNILLDNQPTAALTLLREHTEATPFIEQLEAFLQRHGHRCPNELELLNPRWAEVPEQVIELLAHYLHADENMNPIVAEERQRQRREKVVTATVTRLDPIRRVLLHSVLKKAQQAMTIRDNSRYYVTKFLFPIRKLYACIGRRWVERGWLHQYDDIFFLTTTEVQEISHDGLIHISTQELHTLVAQRRVAYDYWLTVVAPDALGPDGTPLIEEKQATTMLKGVAASSGRVRGCARIIQNVQEVSRLTGDDILVTQATDPGWTPIFPLVKGIVLEVGGQLSHGSIVAREYGIPAVVNVQGALQHIRDGQFIIVDGTQGHVYLEEEKRIPSIEERCS